MKHAFWPSFKGYRDIELGLERTYKILERLDNPHKKLPPIIHIAGTNAKGSTLSFLKSILESCDKKIHCYTSPHLVEINERIILAGEKISDQLLTDCLNICKDACNQEPKLEPTYFEGLTIAAFLAFSKVEADYLLLEVGMGGRLDSTNVIDKSLMSIITPISFDHTDFLGDTIEKIAYEKAGIIKENCPVFVAKQEPEALKVIKEKAQEKNSQVFCFGEDFDLKINQENWDLLEKNSEKWQKIFQPPFIDFLAGEHQLDNACIALYSIISQIPGLVNENRINFAIKNTKWPARLEKIGSGRYFDQLTEIFGPKSLNFELFLDGSHNKAGVKTIKKLLEKYQNKRKIVIFSMLKDKDIDGFLSEIKDEIDLLIGLEIEDENNCYKKEEISQICQKYNINSIVKDNFVDSFQELNNVNENSLIIICGSLYSAGNFIEQNQRKS